MLKPLMPRPLWSALSLLKLTPLAHNRDYRRAGQGALRDFIRDGSLQPHDRVLEVGCGRGRVASALAGYLTSGSYDGFDILAGEVEWCRRTISRGHPRFRLQRADIYNKYHNPSGRTPAEYRFPYPDAGFDFVYLTSVFTHMLRPDVEHYFSETARVLRPSGRCFISFSLLRDSDDTPATRAHFPFEQDGSHLRSRDTPEWEGACREGDVHAWHERHGLSTIVEPIIYGAWNGCPTGSGFQDGIWSVKHQAASPGE